MLLKAAASDVVLQLLALRPIFMALDSGPMALKAALTIFGVTFKCKKINNSYNNTLIIIYL